MLAKRYEAHFDGLSIFITGEVPLMETFGRAALADSAFLVPMAIAVMIGMVALFLKSWRLVSALVLNALMAVSLSLWLFSLKGELLNSATNLIPLVLLVVLSANSLHLLLAIKAGLQQRGYGVQAAIRAALRHNSVPILIASLTTIIGFLLLNAADAPPFHDLGTFVAIGVAIGTLGLLTWVPSVLERSLSDSGDHSDTGGVISSWKVILTADTFLRSRRGIALVVSLGAVGVVGVSRLDLNDNFVEYFDKTYQIRRASDFAAKHLGGPNYLDIQVFSKETGDVYSPVYQETLGKLADWLRRKEVVANVVSVADIVTEIRKAFEADQEGVGTLSSDQIAQYLLTFELSLGAGQDLTDYIDIGGKSTRVNVLLRGGSSRDIITLEKEVYAWFKGNAAAYRVLVTGINVPTAYMSLVNIAGMLTGLAGSVCLIVAIVGIHFRSAAFAFVALLAVLLPIAMGFGFWGWAVGTIGMAAAAVAAITLGVVVDDAIHLLYRYRRARLHGKLSPSAAMSEARRAISPAIVVSSVALVGGFSLLGLSGFAVNSTLGLCTGLILICALVVDLYLVPALIVALDDRLGSLG